MNLQNKNETVSLNTKDKESGGYNSYDLSRTDNIANNASMSIITIQNFT